METEPLCQRIRDHRILHAYFIHVLTPYDGMTTTPPSLDSFEKAILTELFVVPHSRDSLPESHVVSVCAQDQL